MRNHLLIDLLQAASVTVCNDDDVDSYWTNIAEGTFTILIGKIDQYRKTFPLTQVVTIDEDDGFVHSFVYNGVTYYFSFYVLMPYIPK